MAIYASVQYDYQNNMYKKIYLLIGVKFSYSWQLVDAVNCLLKLIMAFLATQQELKTFLVYTVINMLL